MDRIFAVARYAELKLKELSLEERDQQLEIMLLENWNGVRDWRKLPQDLINEFNGDVLKQPPDSERYNKVLKIWIKDDVKAASNHFLKSELTKRGLEISEIYGDPEEYFACPCCGRKTLEERASYDVCQVCWWEDDGQDNYNAYESYGGPNYGISLVQARYNYLTKGIYDPSREDLMLLREPEEKYEIGRVFMLVAENKVSEPAENIVWEIRRIGTLSGPN
jgi:hypothetical protein